MSQKFHLGLDLLLRRTTTSVDGLQAGKKEKVFKLFLVEAFGAGGEPYCFSFIGKGATVCMKRAWSTNHNDERVVYEDGTLLIMTGPRRWLSLIMQPWRFSCFQMGC